MISKIFVSLTLVRIYSSVLLFEILKSAQLTLFFIKMITPLTILRKSAIIGVSSIVLSSVSLSAQALSPNLVLNGGFVPTTGVSANSSAYVGNSKVTINGWTLTSGAFDFVISDGTTYGTNINAANYGVGKVALYATVTGGVTAAVDSPTGSGWYLASDGTYGTLPSIISQTINGLTVGQNYTLSFYQASAQQSGYTGATTDDFVVTFGSSPSQTSAVMNHASQAGVSAWQLETMSFTAQSTSQLLSFMTQGAPNGEPPFALLTGVSLQSTTPIPWGMDALRVVGSTICFLGFGLWSKQKFAQKKLK